MTANAAVEANALGAARAAPGEWQDSFPPLVRERGAGRWPRGLLLLALTLLLGAALYWLRMPGRALALNFDFLWRTAGVGISESRIAYVQEDSFLRLILAGFSNTVFLVLPVCVAAVSLGIVVGVLRLSRNPLLAAITATYVQVMRNVPLLLQILMWYAVLLKLPAVKDSYALGGWFFLNHRGAFFPGLSLTSAWPGLLAGLLLLPVLAAWAIRRMKTASVAMHWRHAVWSVMLLALVLLAAAALSLELPRRGNFNFSGGASVSVEFFTLFMALSVYTSAYIAEIVRGGVLSVRSGQWAAAQALGMTYFQSLVQVVLPQAWLAIVPPLVSQIVNIIKNSSLAVAVGFPDLLWSLTTVIGVTNRTVESVLLLFALYLIPSLIASWLLAQLNRRLLAPRRT